MSNWTQEILDQQQPDGGWGAFHTLFGSQKFQPDNQRADKKTTEQALWRLHILGMTAQDEPIRRAIVYMEACLAQPVSPVFTEKKHGLIFSDRMLAAWLRLFVPEHPAALRVARKWARVIEAAFSDGKYNHVLYAQTYEEQFDNRLNPKAGMLVDFVSFYTVVLLRGLLPPITEDAMLDYILQRQLHYICKSPLNEPPEPFASLEASRYTAALELLAGYAFAPEKLRFARDWLLQNRLPDGTWDFGPKANDGIYFPLSDSWRSADTRRADCTSRVEKLLERLTRSGEAGARTGYLWGGTECAISTPCA